MLLSLHESVSVLSSEVSNGSCPAPMDVKILLVRGRVESMLRCTGAVRFPWCWNIYKVDVWTYLEGGGRDGGGKRRGEVSSTLALLHWTRVGVQGLRWRYNREATPRFVLESNLFPGGFFKMRRGVRQAFFYDTQGEGVKIKTKLKRQKKKSIHRGERHINRQKEIKTEKVRRTVKQRQQ